MLEKHCPYFLCVVEMSSVVYFSSFLSHYIFKWSIIALHNFVVFCHTSTSIFSFFFFLIFPDSCTNDCHLASSILSFLASQGLPDTCETPIMGHKLMRTFPGKGWALFYKYHIRPEWWGCGRVCSERFLWLQNQYEKMVEDHD